MKKIYNSLEIEVKNFNFDEVLSVSPSDIYGEYGDENTGKDVWD